MFEVQTLSVFIPRDWRQVYDTIWRPETFPKWASGLTNASLTQEHGAWTAQSPEGPVTIRFTDYNAFGVMDHYVVIPEGGEMYIPLRIIDNGGGAEVTLTLFRPSGMSDENFAADADWVKRDLAALKALFV